MADTEHGSSCGISELAIRQLTYRCLIMEESLPRGTCSHENLVLNALYVKAPLLAAKHPPTCFHTPAYAS